MVEESRPFEIDVEQIDETVDRDFENLDKDELEAKAWSETQDAFNNLMNGSSRLTTKVRTESAQMVKLAGLRPVEPQEKSGYLHKNSPSFLAGWQKRFVELSNRELRYFKEKDDKKLLQGVVNFDMYSSKCYKSLKSTDPVLIVMIKGCDREFEFKCESESDRNDWITAINTQIAVSKGISKDLSAPKTKEFWRQPQMTELQFIRMADTFDILLFKCNTTGGKIIRTYTGSDFDHAAMVLKFESQPDELFFLEATSNNGVSLKRWSSIRQYLGTFYKKIVFRHLEFDRPDDSLELLEQFMKAVVGNSYSFKLSHLRRKNTIMPSQIARSDSTKSNKSNKSAKEQFEEGGDDMDDTTSEAGAKLAIQEGRAFFCSELVAKAYKVCGIMQQTDEACSNFLPGDLTEQKDRLKLVTGAKLSYETLIFSDNPAAAVEPSSKTS